MTITATATLSNAPATARVRPRSFTPPGDRSARLSHLDPRPLWREEAAVETAWKSPSFWLACLITAPLVGAAKLVRGVR